MAAAKREQGAPLKDRLFDEFYRFSFFQAVTLLERSAHERKPLGQALSPSEEAVRFCVKPGFVFPPSEIAALKQGGNDDQAELHAAFMGLVGPSGLLPDWYNELAVEREQQKDFALTSFLDLFHHRILSLFYLAWKKYRLTVTYKPDAQDRFSSYVLSLVGLGTRHLPGMIGLPEESLMFYAGHLSKQTPSAAAIESVVTYYTGEKVVIDQFVDRRIPLTDDDFSFLGMSNAELGVNTICGQEVWENQTKFRIVIGPMKRPEFSRFLPTGNMLRPIVTLVRYMVGVEYDFEVRLILSREDVSACRLGGTETPASPRLGWSTWISSPGAPHTEDHYVTLQESDAMA